MPGPVSCGAGVCGSAGCVWAGWASPVTVNGASRAAARRSARSRRASERGADMTGKLGRAVPAASQDSGTANSVRFALSDVLVQQDGQGGKRQGGAFARPAGPSEKTMRDRLNFLFLNPGPFLDPFFLQTGRPSGR